MRLKSSAATERGEWGGHHGSVPVLEGGEVGRLGEVVGMDDVVVRRPRLERGLVVGLRDEG
jgi:hypothetical protein